MIRAIDPGLSRFQMHVCIMRVYEDTYRRIQCTVYICVLYTAAGRQPRRNNMLARIVQKDGPWKGKIPMHLASTHDLSCVAKASEQANRANEVRSGFRGVVDIVGCWNGTRASIPPWSVLWRQFLWAVCGCLWLCSFFKVPFGVRVT